MKINAIKPQHVVLLTTYNSVYAILKLKKPGRIKVAILATSNLEFILDYPWMLDFATATYHGLVHPQFRVINGHRLEKSGCCGAAWKYDQLQGLTVTSEIVNVSEEQIHISELQTTIKDGGPSSIHLCTRPIDRYFL